MSGNNLLDLPIVILSQILKLLSLKDLSNLMRTCKRIRNIIHENYSLWKIINGDDLIVENRKVDYYPNFNKYQEARLSYNWRSGYYHTKQLVKYGKKYMPWVRYRPDVLLLSLASELRCYNVNHHGMPNCRKPLWKLTIPKRTLNDIRTTDISRFVIKDTLLACGHRDSTVDVYKVDNERKQPRLIQHITKCHSKGNAEVSCLDLICNQNGSFIVTGSDISDDLSFYHWPKDDGSFEKTYNQGPIRKFKMVPLPGYKGARSIALNDAGNMIAIGPNGDNRAIFVDVETMTLTKDTRQKEVGEIIKDITWHDPNTVAYVGFDSVLSLMDVRSQEVIFEQYDPFRTPLYCVKTDSNNAIVVGASQYARCVLYDRRMDNHVQMYFTQKERSPVYGLDFNSKKLVAAIDRSLGIVDFDANIGSAKRRDYSADVFLSDPS